MIRPSSSTSTVTVRPPKPVFLTTTSTSSEASFRTVRGVVTRSIWTSRGSCSLPTPTVKTGSFCAFIASSAGSSDASLVSAPSVTMTTPATGSPASSSRAPSSAAPSLVCGPLKFISPAVAHARRRGREAEDPHEESIRQRFQQGAVGKAELLFDEGASRLPAPVGNLHAPRIVQEHGHDVLLIDGSADDERGTEETEEDEGQRGHSKRREDDAIAQPAFVDPHAPVRQDGQCDHDRHDQRGGQGRRGDVEAELTLLKDNRAIRKEGLEQRVQHRQAPPESGLRLRFQGHDQGRRSYITASGLNSQLPSPNAQHFQGPTPKSAKWDIMRLSIAFGSWLALVSGRRWKSGVGRVGVGR